MKKDRVLQHRWKMVSGLLVLMAALLIGLGTEAFTIVSHAESAGKVTANSAKIRQEPSTSSTSLGSALKDKTISIRGQIVGSDGYTWYQVFVDANTLGYIRSDLVQITDGSTPPTVTLEAGGTSTPAPATTTPAPANEPLAAVTAVNPVGGSVTGGEKVRVRQNASTTSNIVTTAQSGLALTVTGTATGADGKEWYQVNFIANDAEVSGFIRAEYVAVNGELVPVSSDVPDTSEPVDTAPEPDYVPEVEQKDWDTYYESGKWHLIDNGSGDSYDIENIFQVAKDNKEIAENALKSKKKQQFVIVILVILLIALAVLATYLILRIKDMMDSAYIKEVERETARRRADRPQEGGRRVARTVEPDRRPSGQRPAGSGGQGQRPAGQRPAGGNGQEQRTSGQRPAGQRPVGSGGQGQRPAGQRPVDGGANGQGQRPMGQRPVGGSQGQRMAGAEDRTQRPVSRRPEETSGQQGNGSREPGWKSRNFTASEDDDFEFRFLHGDEEDDR